MYASILQAPPRTLKREYARAPSGGPNGGQFASTGGASGAESKGPEVSATALGLPAGAMDLPKETTQPVKDPKELFDKSTEALAFMSKWLDEGKGVLSAAGYVMPEGGMTPENIQKPGKLLFIAPIKGMARSEEKVNKEYGGDWDRLLDVARASVAVDNLSQIKDVVTALSNSGMQLAKRPKNRFEDPTEEGYRDLMLNVKAPNGIVMELQVHLKSMLDAKDKGHADYEIIRTLLGDHGKDTSVWPSREKAKLDKARADSHAIYDPAWDRATVTKGATMDAFKYYDHDNAVYRKPANNEGPWIHEVRVRGAWVPYTGSDALAPVFFGSQIGRAEAEGDGPALPVRPAQPPMVLKQHTVQDPVTGASAQFVKSLGGK